MIKILIEKELKTILLSPKFVAVFSVCSILILLSFYIGIDEYRVAMNHYEAVNAQLAQQTLEQTSWAAVRLNIVRHPDPLHIFVSGINNDIGRQCPITRGDVIKLYGSRYSDQLLFSIFRSMDLMFIVQVVLSLFAILFTYDSICGEREAGTLKLNFANPIPRTSYIISKIVGSWLGLSIPLIIPMLLGLALVLVCGIPMTVTHWAHLLIIIGVSVIYFSFFICLGVMFSSITKAPSSSFLYLLVIWIGFVLIIPRAGVMVAGQFISVPTPAEITSKLTQKEREMSEQLDKWQKGRRKELESALASLTIEEQQKKYMEMVDQYNKDLTQKYDELNREIDKYYISLNEEWRNRKGQQETLGFSLSRFSPASAFQLAAMELAATGIRLKADYEDQLQIFKDMFNKFRAKKEEETGRSLFTMLNDDKKPNNIDTSDIPEFRFVNRSLSQIMQTTIIDIGILAFYILITIAGTFIAFIRYDVR